MKFENVTKREAAYQLGRFLNTLDDNARVTLEVKKYRPRRTLTQNAFEHLLYDYIGKHSGMNPDLIKEHVKQEYGPWKRVFDKNVPIPSSQCDIFEIGQRIEGCFAVMDYLDMYEAKLNFLKEWQELKREKIKSLQKAK